MAFHLENSRSSRPLASAKIACHGRYKHCATMSVYRKKSASELKVFGGNNSNIRSGVKPASRLGLSWIRIDLNAGWASGPVITAAGGGAVVPEPSSMAMFGIGALGLLGYSRRLSAGDVLIQSSGRELVIRDRISPPLTCRLERLSRCFIHAMAHGMTTSRSMRLRLPRSRRPVPQQRDY